MSEEGKEGENKCRMEGGKGWVREEWREGRSE